MGNMILDVSHDLLLRLVLYWFPAALFLLIAVLSARRMVLHRRWFGSSLIIVVSLWGAAAQVEMATRDVWPHMFGFIFGAIGIASYGAQTWLRRYRFLS
jgi:hypothetical protein